MKKPFVPTPALKANNWRIKTVLLAYTCNAASLKLLKNKLTAAAVALLVLILHGEVQNWTPMNWLELAMLFVFVYGAVFASLAYLKSTSEQFLIAHGICDKDGKCPSPF